MKKLLIMLVATSMMAGVNAQEAAEKKILAGLTLGTGLNFNNPQTNAINSNVGGDFYAGMALDWHFLSNIALSTGLEFEFNRFRHEFNLDTYFDYSDKVILQRGKDQDITVPPNTDDGAFQLDERRYRNIYLNLPIMLRFQTNYMGYLRYFGKFGLRNSFLLSTRADNFGQSLDDSNTELEDMQNPGDLSFYKGSLGLSVGAEWNFAGSTCLVAELGFYYGISEVHKQDALGDNPDRNKSLYTYTEDENGDLVRGYYSPTAKQNQLILKVAFLF